MHGLDNILLMSDSYKVSHYRQYPPGTETVYSYFESRGGVFPDIVFFGLQYLLKRYLCGSVVDSARIDEAQSYFASHFTDPTLFNRSGWDHIAHTHGGRLPVSIKAVPEGSVVPFGNVLMTIENTAPDCYWLTNYLETLLVQAWYPCTVATQSRFMKQTLLEFLAETGDPSQIDFKLHDFGFRGSTSVESSGLGSASHLVNFRGTDSLSGLVVARQYYGEHMAGFSIPAAEHSTVTSWGREGEVDAMRNMLVQFPEGLVAVVSDSYDIFHACSELWGRELKDEVLGRNGTLVVRPDSGDPPTTVVKVLDLLGEAFGTETNQKGYRVLDPHVRVIQGDGIDREMLRSILDAMRTAGWSGDNVAFGSGGGLLQRLDRDTCKFAFKCAEITVDGVPRDVFKQPVTDLGKRSKAGRMKLVRSGASFETVPANDSPGDSTRDDQLVEVFRDGELLVDQSFADIRARAGTCAINSWSS
ncbi:MAG: nicotinate phosphoribosyltransferase [Planctomycetota bacterium]|nr:nicotinate phosphoribosyltransferase [Planctomycetota bacterium]